VANHRSPVGDDRADLVVQPYSAVGQELQNRIPMRLPDMGDGRRACPLAVLAAGHPDGNIIFPFVRSAKPCRQNIPVWKRQNRAGVTHDCGVFLAYLLVKYDFVFHKQNSPKKGNLYKFSDFSALNQVL
jgi:hypothetical protein